MSDGAKALPRWAMWTLVAGALALVSAVTVRAVTVAGQTPASDSLSAAQNVEARLEAIDDKTYGTWEQHSAGAYLDYLANTAAVEPCMADKGETFGYPFIDPFAGRADSGLGSSWAAPLMRTTSSQNALASARYNWVAERESDGNPDTNWYGQTKSYQRAYAQCRHLRKNHRGHPRGWLGVPNELAQLVFEAENPFGPTSEYDDCMLDAGYDVYWDDFGGPDAMHQMVEAEAPVLDLPPDQLVQTEEWKEYLAFEQDVLKADYECRATRYALVMAELDAPLAEFERSHAEEIAEMQAKWEALVAEAKAQGWTPQT
ncbi:MAG TPA: hypothetical protein VFX15_04470 [Actinomycetes bacterium]|nr:hypothetical protein [Actinomycetes bacterium]